MSRGRKHKTHEKKIICYRVSDNLEKQEEYQHDVSIFSAELNYQGQKLKVNIEQIKILRKLTDGGCGPLLIANIEEQSNIQMTVEELSLDGGYEHFFCPADLATIEFLNTKNCPYIIGYYGAVLDKSRVELLLCMESMDASMDTFYRTVHSLDNLTTVIEWKHILSRLINNIASALNFLTINGVNHRWLKPSTILVNRQALFKLCDVGMTKQNRSSKTCHYSKIDYYDFFALMLTDGLCNIHPGIWTFGLYLFEILTGQYPFLNKSLSELLMSIRTWTPTFPSNQINLEEIQQIIIQLLKTDKQVQPQNYIEILEIPCIKDVTEKVSNNEIDFIARIIDHISLESD